MSRVELFEWNPKRPAVTGPLGRILPRKRVNNFGDLLGPLIVRHTAKELGIDVDASVKESRQLFSVGSVIHLAPPGATVWGAGVNGKIATDRIRSPLDIRAVRGPLTRDRLVGLGHVVPSIYGDPALLLPRVRPDLANLEKTREELFVPNLNDVADWASWPILDPRSELESCLQAIASSKFVVASSLHAVVVADALGIPARLVKSSREPEFKYKDYFEGTNREVVFAETPGNALELGPHTALNFDTRDLIGAFPADLWRGRRSDRNSS